MLIREQDLRYNRNEQGRDMKNLSLVLSLLILAALMLAQQQHDITVRNVTVPVRVFDGDRFVDDLSIEDLELLEDGKPQTIQALYLTRKTSIARMEGRDYMPYPGRSYFFIFQLRDYHPRIKEAFAYFFERMYDPKDEVVILTPLKQYNLSKEAVASSPKEEVVEYIQATVRKDTVTAAQHYNSLMKDLIRHTHGVATGNIEHDVPLCQQYLQKLDEITAMEQKRLVRFASQLKRLEGQKNVFYFCQSEYRPKLSSMAMSGLQERYHSSPGVWGQIQDLFLYRKDPNLDQDEVTEMFADSSILFNFIFINKRPPSEGEVRMQEQSEDAFELFSKVAASTGGISDSSQNLAAAFEHSANVSESYYLLYYSPENYRKDGSFKTITVRVKGKNYKVFHRQGYIAD